MNNRKEDYDIIKACDQGRKVLDAYWEYYRLIEPQLPESIKIFDSLYNPPYSMHDCLIVKSGFVDKNFHMDIDSSSGSCSVEKLTFINAEIVEKDSDLCLDNAYWVSNKIYLRGNKYEMHILLTQQNNERANMTIAFDDIIIEGNWETNEA